jgi:hypothetical protein
LEIGVNTPAQPGFNWPNIKAEVKHGVDPEENTEATFKVTSDEFFKSIINQKYDFIFVDGLHTFQQCYRDIHNSLMYLNEGGTIMAHDTLPASEIAQRPDRVSDHWNGDVWKSIVKLRLVHNDIKVHTVDTDEGCTIIQKGEQNPLKLKDGINENYVYTYDAYLHNRKHMLNVISVDDFKKLYLE